MPIETPTSKSPVATQMHAGRAIAALLTLLASTSTPAVAQDQTEAESNAEARTVAVAVRDAPPFSMKNAQGEWTGICVDLLREVQAEIRAAGREVTIDYREMGLDELLDAVERGKVDMGAGAITLNYERELRMDFTHPFYSSGLGIAVGANQRDQGWLGIASAVISPTFMKVVAALLAALLISAVAVYFFERRGNPEQFGGGPARGIGSGLWWAAVTLTTVGYGDKAPKTLPGRLIGLVWMFAGLFIIASFTASVTSVLTVTQLKTGISGPGDLPSVRVATVEGSTAESYLRNRGIVPELFSGAADALGALRQERVAAVVYDEPILRYQINQADAPGLHVLPVTFEPQEYAFPIPDGSPLRERINQSLLRTTSQPGWREVLNGYLGEPPTP
ncbi:Cyclic nucleotide-gated potassium channel [Posidoniimonas corsicana]|uniref:Cyclic nucleotide-gated potassium channel n=1 Tax=Posidoniimonas corsicana TaxID=1938618 RepID=A0A5C5V0D1_9BACT|nr:transporter substrate-binding domain-containing protein [Posidoniimonas corsicana]TWT31202.1 Cyclic nucleotide-gated potassium channel [Posidoniimonas corsicana]